MARRLLALCLWLCLAASAAAEPAPAPELLVMLRLPPDHYRPGADYNDTYGAGMARAARRRVAERLAAAHGLTLVKDWPMPLLGLDCFVMRLPDGRSPQDEAAKLSAEPGVAWAEPVRAYHGEAGAVSLGDPLFAAQPAAGAWRLAELHQIATGRGVKVAVIDSAVETGHPDLAGQVAVARDFAPDHAAVAEDHGTGVAGVIGAKAGNNVGIVGVAPEARLLALRACWQTPPPPARGTATVCDTLSLALALEFAVEHGAQVVNLSLAGPPAPLLGRLIDVALARGATVVAAFDPDLPGGGFPASHPGVIDVADDQMRRPPAGVYLAPGRGVPTTQPGGRWFLVDGSSYAAAHVSGLYALMRQRSGAARGASALATPHAGGGEIDACASLLRAAGPCDRACAGAPKFAPRTGR